ncbi:esterase [Verrucomicrobiota bacterium]|nr:esterase [Verrucomicrobiota bacterium]
MHCHIFRTLFILGPFLLFSGCESAAPPARVTPVKPRAAAVATKPAKPLPPPPLAPPTLPPAVTPTAPFHTHKLAELDAAVTQAIADGRLPGGVLWLEHRGAVYQKSYGRRAVIPAPEPMSDDTIFDAASLTKVLATTPAIMLLIERGKLQIDAAVTNYLPEFAGDGRERVTLRHLLTHTSGLRSGLGLANAWTGSAHAIALACGEKLRQAPGAAFLYSDINFILLGEIVQRVSGQRLDQFVTRELYQPLRMSDTGYLPEAGKLSRIAPTENHKTEGLLRGRVHDPTARRMGGVAGHAGVFTTAADLARYARMMLQGGELDGVRVFPPEAVRWMTSVQSPAGVAARRGIGWDIDSPFSGPRGKHFPIGSFGHTGWTGTSVWIDPASRTFLIFLANRNHPNEAAGVGELRARLATLAAEAIADFNFGFLPDGRPASSPSADTALSLNTGTNSLAVPVEKTHPLLTGRRAAWLPFP